MTSIRHSRVSIRIFINACGNECSKIWPCQQYFKGEGENSGGKWGKANSKMQISHQKCKIWVRSYNVYLCFIRDYYAFTMRHEHTGRQRLRSLGHVTHFSELQVNTASKSETSFEQGRAFFVSLSVPLL